MSTPAQKEEQYQKYDWSQNEKWLSYLSNVYPTPPMARLDKMKRRWYKNNIDKEFSIEPVTGQQQQQFRQNQYFPQMQIRPDVKPELKGMQFVAWLMFIFSFTGIVGSPTLAGFGALVAGVIRKGGFPRMNMDYVQSILPDENTQMLGMLAIASSAGPFSIVCWGPIVIHGALICAWISNDPTPVSGIYLKVIELFKKTGLLRRVLDNQSQLWTMRHDLECYMGIYLTLGVVAGVSSILSALIYWQIMRMRYLMSPACQQAFSRLDQSARQLFGNRWCPGIVLTIYDKVAGFLKGQIDSTMQTAQQQSQGDQPTGLRGAFARATQSCTVF